MFTQRWIAEFQKHLMRCSLKQTPAWRQLMLTVWINELDVRTALVKPGNQRGCWLGVPDTTSVRLSCHSLVFFWAAVGRAAAACTHAVMHAHHSRSHSRDWTSHLLTLPHATVNYCSVCSCFSVWAAGMPLVWCLFPCLNRYNHVSRLHKFTEVPVQLSTVCWRLSFIVCMGYLLMLLHFENILNRCFNSLSNYLDWKKKYLCGLFSCDDDNFLFVLITAVGSVISCPHAAVFG